MKKIWDTYFYWNKTERRGVVPLLVLMFLLLAVDVWLSFRRTTSPMEPDQAFLAEAEKFFRAQAADEEEVELAFRHRDDKSLANPIKRTFKKPTAPFNPNDLSAEGWESLGMSTKQAEVMERFLEKGGMFYGKEDIRKMYVVSEEFFLHIEPYLLFPERKKKSSQFVVAEKTLALIDINTADSVALGSLPGINAKMVSKILAVRQQFGGFLQLEQIGDLKGFYAGYFPQLKKLAYVGEVEISPLNINYCTFKELMQVPGTDYETVKAIIRHREINGFFKETDELVTLNLAKHDIYVKIAPYLKVR